MPSDLSTASVAKKRSASSSQAPTTPSFAIPERSSGAGNSAAKRVNHREARPPAPRLVDGATVVFGLGLGASIALAFVSETSGQFYSAGGVATFLGNLTALVGTYMALLMVFLISRLGFVERTLGQDRLVKWHRRVGPWTLVLISAHVLLTTIGYAQAAKTGVLHELWTFINGYPDMLIATVGFGLMLVAGIASASFIRRRMRRETWWAIHLYMYVALSLAFAHEVVLGPSFVAHPLTKWLWSGAWIIGTATILSYRIILPVVRSMRHGLRVAEVRDEAPGVVSVICSGRRLDRLAVSGGQFFSWRFLVRGMWWQAHPYSISALPHPPYIRLTVKAVGDHSEAVSKLGVGTRVFIEGPYGVFTRHSQRHQKAALISGGIGITALRSLLEDLPAKSYPTVLIRATQEEHLVFRSEIVELVKHRRGTLHELVGSRDQVGLDEHQLGSLIPDIANRDVFICGPDGFVETVTEAVRQLGTPEPSIHHEAFSL